MTIEMEPSVREAIHYRMCKHVCNSMLAVLKEVKKFNILAVYNLNLDVRELESRTLQPRSRLVKYFPS